MEVVGDPGAALQEEIRAVGARSAKESTVAANRARRFVYGAAATYAVVLAGFSVLHYASYGYGRFDLGNMVQAVWSTSHGRFLETTSLTGTQMSRLGAHADPFLALLAPFWRLWPSPLLLLVLQAVAVAAGALPVYWLARKHLRSDEAPALIALAYLVFPATQFNAFTPAAGFHAVSLALPFLLFAIWFLDEDRLAPFTVVALLALTTKEEIGASVGCLGIWYALRRGHRLVGAAIFCAGIGAALVNFLVIIPHFAPTGTHPFSDRYSDVGGTPGGILHKALTDPGELVSTVATPHKAIYLALLLLPFLGFWLFEPLLLLAATPDLVINLLSSKPQQTTLEFQYTAGIAPFLIAATILGIERLRRDPTRLSFYVLAGTMCIAAYSPIYLSSADFAQAFSGDPARAAKAHAVEMVPSYAPVAASNKLAGRLSQRRFIFVFPYVKSATWLLVDAADDTMGENKAYRRAIARFVASPRWRVAFRSRGIYVLRRAGGTG
jgi:uncharacterized membrane protein